MVRTGRRAHWPPRTLAAAHIGRRAHWPPLAPHSRAHLLRRSPPHIRRPAPPDTRRTSSPLPHRGRRRLPAALVACLAISRLVGVDSGGGLPRVGSGCQSGA
eukprot:2965027-Prymnesium_polylepis.1